MSAPATTQLIAVVGGSGAGKSWLARQLCAEFGDDARSVSLDNFYRDLSHLSVTEREQINFDHPDAIDWPRFEHAIHQLREGRAVMLPRYDFSTHTRLSLGEIVSPRPLIFVEGLWLLLRPGVSSHFAWSLYLDCAETLRWERRLIRDCHERGRSVESVRQQFYNTVAPMHGDFVERQKPRADYVIQQPTSAEDFERLVATIALLRGKSMRLSARLNSAIQSPGIL